jgi:NADH pyrophosphatase NudC (nudix superfamily)
MLRDEIAKLLNAYAPWNTTGLLDAILALIDAQRCVWTKDGTINGQETYYTSCDMVDFLEGYDFCPKCGKRIEVKEGEDART